MARSCIPARLWRQSKLAFASGVKDILLPHQFEVLRIAAVSTYTDRSPQKIIADALLDQGMELSNEQREALNEKAEEIDRKLKQDIAKLKGKAWQELLSELKPAERKAVEKSLGLDLFR